MRVTQYRKRGRDETELRFGDCQAHRSCQPQIVSVEPLSGFVDCVQHALRHVYGFTSRNRQELEGDVVLDCGHFIAEERPD
jgi:hypothetical protein